MTDESSESKLDYATAGVDIDKEDEAISRLVKTLKYARPKGIGSPLELPLFFTGLIEFNDEFALSLCTDGVGSKVLIASVLKKWDTVGIDCIAMNVNDMICIGAEPLAFVDYLAMEDPDPLVTEQIGIGLAKGAELANISLIGGETASLPEIINGFDLAGTCLGIVKKDRIITGENIAEGDSIFGLRSTGIHSNGLTLARKIFEVKGYDFYTPISEIPDIESQELLDRMVGEVLLTPTEIYVKEVLEAVKRFNFKGMANITGGGLRNVKRMNKKFQYRITDPIEPHTIFNMMQKLGNVSTQEMYQTFNMGMGFCFVASADEADAIAEFFNNSRLDCKIVGEVVAGEGVVVPALDLKY
jgi:phosphoribosylformylglycinamidine cyclo-ligase